MSRLEDLKPNAAVRGVLADSLVTVVNVQWYGSETLELTYKDPAGRVANVLLYRHDEPRLEVAEQGRPWELRRRRRALPACLRSAPQYVSDGRIAIVTLNRPQANNRLNGAIAVRLTEILEKLDASLSVRAVILTGAGKAFSHGGDTHERKEMTKEQWLTQRTRQNRLLYTLRNSVR